MVTDPQRGGGTALATGAALCALLVTLDLLLGLRSSPDTGLGALGAPLAATAGATALLFAISWLALGPVRRACRLSPAASALGLATWLGGACVLLLALQRMQVALGAPVVVGALLVALVAGALVTVTANVIERVVPLAARVRRLAWLTAGLAVLAGGLAWARQGRVSAPGAPGAPGPTPSVSERGPFTGKVRQVLLIVIDTLRADALSCYAPGAGPTPALDALAAQSLVYESARSAAPWTLPAMCSILTGLAPAVHLAVRGESVLPDAAPTLAESLRAAGYRTAAIGRNAFLLPRARLARGFDEYTWFPRLAAGTPLGGALLAALFPPRVSAEPDAAELTDLACDWIEQHADEPFFLWLHYFDPHWPYEPSAEFQPPGTPPPGLGRRFAVPIAEVRTGHFAPDLEQRAWVRALYDGEVRYTDHELGRLFARLRELGIHDEALVVLTSDHGEELWEHDSFEHGHSVYDEVLRVPLIVKPPPNAAGATPGRIHAPVSTQSIAPTILAQCGLAVPPELGPALPASEPSAPSELGPVFASGLLAHENRSAVILGTKKYVRRAITGREHVWDLAVDPAELFPRAGAEAGETLAELARLLTDHAAASAALRERLGIGASASGELDEATRRELQALGYLR